MGKPEETVSVGINCVNQSYKEGLVLRIWRHSTLLFWKNRHGNSLLDQNLLWLGFLQACNSLKQDAWYLWKRVRDGIRLLILGARWRIGDGRTVNVWNDPWLPKPYTFKPLSYNRSTNNKMDVWRWISGSLPPRAALFSRKVIKNRGNLMCFV